LRLGVGLSIPLRAYLPGNRRNRPKKHTITDSRTNSDKSEIFFKNLLTISVISDILCITSVISEFETKLNRLTGQKRSKHNEKS